MNEYPSVWSLQEAKAKFSELIRRAQTEGPQTLTCRGEPVATITALIAAPKKEEDKRTGADLVAAIQACPHPEFFDELDRIREEDRCFVDHVNELRAKDDEAKQLRAQRANEVCP